MFRVIDSLIFSLECISDLPQATKMKYLFLIAACLGLVAGEVVDVFKVENEKDGTEHTNCHSLHKAGYRNNGTYRLILGGERHHVPCEFGNGFGFTIILFREDALVHWDRSFRDYEMGFGYPMHDFFAGLIMINAMTSSGKWAVMSSFRDWDDKEYYSVNSPFSIGGRSSGYQLRVGPHVHGNVPDALSYSNGQRFYTVDYPDPNHCVKQMLGGWWYKFCSQTLPTGHYYNHGHYTTNKTLGDGIFWSGFKGPLYSLKKFVISLHPAY